MFHPRPRGHVRTNIRLPPQTPFQTLNLLPLQQELYIRQPRTPPRQPNILNPPLLAERPTSPNQRQRLRAQSPNSRQVPTSMECRRCQNQHPSHTVKIHRHHRSRTSLRIPHSQHITQQALGHDLRLSHLRAPRSSSHASATPFGEGRRRR